MAKTATTATRKSIGLGFLPEESRHAFLIHIPRGTAKGELITISEYRGDRFSAAETTALPAPPPSDPSLRVVLDRGRWNALATPFWEEANRRLRANGLATAKLTKSPTKPIPVHPSLGKELCVLCWAVEDVTIDDIPNALRNWEALAPEERWWLYTMTVATTGQALQKGVGWRKALRAALADNPFVKGEGMSPKARRELLGHAQLALTL